MSTAGDGSNPPIATAPAVRRGLGTMVGIVAAAVATMGTLHVLRLLSTSFATWVPDPLDVIVAFAVGLGTMIGLQAASDILPGHPRRDQRRYCVTAALAGALAGGITGLVSSGPLAALGCAAIAILPALLSGVAMVVLIRRQLSQGAMQLLIRRSLCARCGYDLRGSSVPRCPECGAWRK